MTSASYVLGNVVRLAVEIKVSGVLTDPTTLTIKVKKVGGPTETFTWAAGQVTRDSVGAFHKDYTPASAGEYVWHSQSTGAATGASKRRFLVEDDEVD